MDLINASPLSADPKPAHADVITIKTRHNQGEIVNAGL